MASNNNVGISLMKSDETHATLEYLGETAQGVRVSDRDSYYKIERDNKIELDTEWLISMCLCIDQSCSLFIGII